MMRHVIAALACAVLVQGATGCFLAGAKFADGPDYVPVTVPPDKGAVVFFREHKTRNSAIQIFMDVPVAANNCVPMRAGAAYTYVADPGHVEALAIGATPDKPRTSFGIDFKAGETHYVQVEYEDHKPQLVEVSAEDAQKLLGDDKSVPASCPQ